MSYVISLLLKNWEVISAFALFVILIFCFSTLGKRLERLERVGLIKTWFSNVGSDVRVFGIATSFTLTIAYWANLSSEIAPWLTAVGIVIAKLSFLFWGVLIAIAFVDVAQPHYSHTISILEMSITDKRNLKTLIPLIASVTQLLIYVTGVVMFLHTIGVDISPLINISTIAFAVFGFAGTRSLEDMLSAIKIIFVDRLYYVGSTIEIPSPDGVFRGLRGEVIKITLFNTTIKLESGRKLIISNSLIRTLIVHQP
jgi:small-conductance mechanosensitive channel